MWSFKFGIKSLTHCLMTCAEHSSVYFQQDSAIAHTATACMTELCFIFGRIIISNNQWPLKISNLTLCDFYLWEHLKMWLPGSSSGKALGYRLDGLGLIPGVREVEIFLHSFMSRLDLGSTQPPIK